MRRLLLSIFLLGGLAVTASGQTGKITLIPDTSYSQRDTFVTISIVADANLTNVKALQLDLDVTSAVIFADTAHITMGSLFVNNADSTFFYRYLSPDKSRLTLDFAVIGDGKMKAGPGTIATVRYKTVGFGQSDIAIASYKLRDSSNQAMPLLVENAWVKVCRYVGDINGDNRIDLADLSWLVSYLTTAAPVPTPLASANTNCFGIVDLADLSLLVAYLTTGYPICKLCL
ncbi:MAG: hypothetical protein WAU88_10535 [Candidatus Zixiibacteriota bacterium]